MAPLNTTSFAGPIRLRGLVRQAIAGRRMSAGGNGVGVGGESAGPKDRRVSRPHFLIEKLQIFSPAKKVCTKCGLANEATLDFFRSTFFRRSVRWGAIAVIR